MQILKTLHNLDPYNLLINQSKTLPLQIYNYTPQSPKYDEVTREARGLCLSGNKVVARGFRRFFNLGENPNETFGGPFRTFEKLDGSLILLYFLDCPEFKGWRINTRNGFGDNILGEVPAKELFWRNFDYPLDNLDPEITYTFELVGPENRVVRDYPEGVYLTGAFDKNGMEVNQPNWRNRPQEFDCKSLGHVRELLEKYEKEDPTYEGFVLLDEKGERLKVKSSQYIFLHRKIQNHKLLDEDIVKLILLGEDSEFLCYFPEYKSKFNELHTKIYKTIDIITTTYNMYKNIDSQKEFAISVKHLPYAWIYFLLRKNNSINNILLENLSKFAITI